MSLIRATVKLNHISGIPEDAAVNVWHFTASPSPGGEDALYPVITLALGDFYRHWGRFLSHAVSRVTNAHTIEYRLVTSGAPGAADDTVSVLEAVDPWTLSVAASAASSLPSEVATVLSFNGFGFDAVPEESGATRPRARHRGRVYLGPFTIGITDIESVTFRTRIPVAVRTEILGAYQDMCDAVNAVDVLHAVYSPKSSFAWTVVEAWMDDAFDTIRSRGEAPTTRSSILVQI